jgi:hypothetical protein
VSTDASFLSGRVQGGHDLRCHGSYWRASPELVLEYFTQGRGEHGNAYGGVVSSEPRPVGNCPMCHRLDVSHRVTIGVYTRVTCRLCASGYKKTPGVKVTIEELKN